jgi:hypothetical protein
MKPQTYVNGGSGILPAPLQRPLLLQAAPRPRPVRSYSELFGVIRSSNLPSPKIEFCNIANLAPRTWRRQDVATSGLRGAQADKFMGKAPRQT